MLIRKCYSYAQMARVRAALRIAGYLVDTSYVRQSGVGYYILRAKKG